MYNNIRIWQMEIKYYTTVILMCLPTDCFLMEGKVLPKISDNTGTVYLSIWSVLYKQGFHFFSCPKCLAV